MVWGLRIGGMAAAGLALLVGPAMHGQTPPSEADSIQQVEVPTEASERYLPPVYAEVVDHFRPPAHVGAPGNRGLEYGPNPGQPVWASADGEVVFAGAVVYNRFVTVLHRDGLRTAYGYLGWIAVAKGDWVEAGQLLGTTSERFFFSVRAGDTYLDPGLVLNAGRVRLVPHRDPEGRSRLSAYGKGG
ncbi:MAG: M23 family metallopeptidase [bacterium]|nr:M23 family metallopeptidase [bacterium]MYH72753.1 M23 family metallopeptidase [Acidimicrobiia bacterium]